MSTLLPELVPCRITLIHHRILSKFLVQISTAAESPPEDVQPLFYHEQPNSHHRIIPGYVHRRWVFADVFGSKIEGDYRSGAKEMRRSLVKG